MIKKILAVIAAIGLTWPAQALTEKDFTRYLGEVDSYSSHTLFKDIALLVIQDEVVLVPYIINLKTRQKFEVYLPDSQSGTFSEMMIFPGYTGCAINESSCPKAGGVQYSDLKEIAFELKVSSRKCNLYRAIWNAQKRRYEAQDRGQGSCLFKHVF